MSEIGKKRYPQKPISDAELAKWGRYWYGRLRDFHQAGNGWEWRFSEPQVISFARRLLADGVPAWKRLKVVENLGWYRDHVLKTDEPSLDFSRRKLKEAVALEKHNAASDEANDVPMTIEDIEEIAGVIDPKEPEPLQAIRRKIRLEHKAFATEEAYVHWVKRFMEAHHLTTLASFSSIRSTDIEDFLTRLAVDDAVAAGTQDQAFYAILYLYQHVLDAELAV